MLNFNSNIFSTPESQYKEYNKLRDEYMELCEKYSFSPRQISLFLMGGKRLDQSDKQRLIQLIIQVAGLEHELVDVIEDCLFAKKESDYTHSALFVV